ncbi:nucleotide pyrophosphohydrolase [Mucilaginibacter achroorhodeus]|uniref:Nucleotide pyrophosphohydrolase n=1 Tax=Mucilaginibacter achroorhodeus TaxID=2599294 RepID=A0A563UAL0_9SPHI|nr:nucleoside triphosphate pyrophosphohydrolase family protein [Mucilaginibacter achroorhodeus]TWR28356.1 nucleotide pyrophosphohydrolase [Mucilaginibacter achroorhodeus]
MELNQYQKLAKEYDQNPNEKIMKSYIIPLFGVIGESGALISEFKKSFRDKAAHTKFKANVEEILGNILWYVANVASKLNLELDAITSKNLQKIKERFPKSGEIICVTELFDQNYPDNERLPRRVILRFEEVNDNDNRKVKIFLDNQEIGDALTDNSYEDDGYRYHDVFHFAFAAVLGWSPVVRALTRSKRKSNPKIDEIEDGARAAIIEEAISAFIYQYARDHNFYNGIDKVDNFLIKTIRNLSSNLEVSVCSVSEWEKAILEGYGVFRNLVKFKGGNVLVDLDNREIQFLGNAEVN